MHELLPELDAIVCEIEADDCLEDDTYFVERMYALDRLGRQVLDRIENVLYVQGFQDDLADVYRRAAYLQRHFESINTQLFQDLRGELSASSHVQDTFQQLCQSYVDRSQPPPPPEGDDTYLDLFINGVLGIELTPAETLDPQPSMIGYVPTPAQAIFALLSHLKLSQQDTFYDLGSGLGRVPLLVGLLTSARAVGVEIEPAYYHLAQQCAARLSLTQVNFINADARQVNYQNGTVFFLYTPFTGLVMQTVLDQLHDVARVHPITLAAYGPCTPVVEQQNWLRSSWCQSFDTDTLLVCTSH